MRRSDALRAWAEELYLRHAPDIADILGIEAVPPIRVHAERHGHGAAWTRGTDVFLSAPWFAEHPDDAGGCLHEFTHAIMRAPAYDENTAWLIEGIADYVRDVLGFDAAWTFAHPEPGKALAGYQTTAHFLVFLEGRHPGTVRELSRRLAEGTYTPEAFRAVTGRGLPELVASYEAAQS